MSLLLEIGSASRWMKFPSAGTVFVHCLLFFCDIYSPFGMRSCRLRPRCVLGEVKETEIQAPLLSRQLNQVN